jgi:hypothetical protein
VLGAAPADVGAAAAAGADVAAPGGLVVLVVAWRQASEASARAPTEVTSNSRR